LIWAYIVHTGVEKAIVTILPYQTYTARQTAVVGLLPTLAVHFPQLLSVVQLEYENYSLIVVNLSHSDQKNRPKNINVLNIIAH